MYIGICLCIYIYINAYIYIFIHIYTRLLAFTVKDFGRRCPDHTPVQTSQACCLHVCVCPETGFQNPQAISPSNIFGHTPWLPTSNKASLRSSHYLGFIGFHWIIVGTYMLVQLEYPVFNDQLAEPVQPWSPSQPPPCPSHNSQRWVGVVSRPPPDKVKRSAL